MTPAPLSRYQIRPLPYYNTEAGAGERALARALRGEFVPKVRRLLPGHHLGGLRHDTAVRFVRRHKRAYPCFVKADIRRFFPGIRHKDAVVGAQIAYRDLLGLDYVPRTFKERYVGPLHAWLSHLPLHCGLPIGSPLSGVLGPAMLLPLWLRLKREFGCPMLVYMDDVLICTEDERQAAEVYAYMDRYLHREWGLELNRDKSGSGRFATSAVVFCGWEFAGGYAHIAPEKEEAFRERIRSLVRRVRKPDARAFIKRLNRKIDGFGHYYKYGDVRSQFRVLDQFLRQQARHWYAREVGGSLYRREALAALGLRSLEDILTRAEARDKRLPARNAGRRLRPLTTSPSVTPPAARHALPAAAEFDELLGVERKIQRQLTQLIALQRQQLALLTQLVNV